MPYLICDKCYTYYELEEGELDEDMGICECGNKLKYYENLTDFTEELDINFKDTKNENLMDLWFKQSNIIKLASVLLICFLGVFIIAGISGTFSNLKSVDSKTVSNEISKQNIVVLYASWCSACHEFEQALSNSRVQEKIKKNYNLQIINVDNNRDEALKYSHNGVVTLPTIIILDANGNEIRRHEGYLEPDELLGFL